MPQPNHINYFAVPGLKDRNKMPIRIKVDKEIIIRTICEYFDIHRWQIESHKRDRKYVIPRQIAFYYLRRLTSLKCKQIGEILNRDHTTVIHSIEMVNDLSATDMEYKNKLEEVGEMIIKNAISSEK